MKKSLGVLFSSSAVLLFAILIYLFDISDGYAQGFPKVHLITLQEDQGDTSLSCSSDVYGINSLFLDWKNKSEPVNLGTSDGKNKILREIEKVNVGKDDVLFFYYAGHGESDNRNNLFLTLSGKEKLNRQELRRILEDKKARFTVLITDACAVTYQNNEGPRAIPIDDSYLLSNLKNLLSSNGVVDINSSTPPNEYAISTDYVSRRSNESYTGGVFTQSFLFLICESQQETWAELLKTTAKEVNNRYNIVKSDIQSLRQAQPRNQQINECWQKISNQKTQTPYIISLPNGEKTQTSLSPPNKGVKIAQVYPNTTASSLENEAGKRILPEPGDYLCSINGQAIKSDAEFKKTVSGLPKNSKIVVEIIDHRTQKTMTLYGKIDVSSNLRFGLSLTER